MVRWLHPRATDAADGACPSAVGRAREKYPVGDDGAVESPPSVLRDYAAAYDVDPARLRVDGELNQQSEDDTGDSLVKDDGDDSGGPDGCPYCDEYEGHHVAQHVAQAHPDASD